MPEEKLLELPQLIALVWGRLMMKKRYQSAMLAALLGYVLSRETPNEELEKGSMALLLKAVDELRGEDDYQSASQGLEPSCSFCGRSEPEVRLAGGGRAFICSDCTNIASEVFREKAEQ